jgi:hypothetical protein
MQLELEIDRIDTACDDALSFRDIESRQIAGPWDEAAILITVILSITSCHITSFSCECPITVVWNVKFVSPLSLICFYVRTLPMMRRKENGCGEGCFRKIECNAPAKIHEQEAV